MSTWRAVLLGLVVTLSGAASGSAATVTSSTCLVVQPTAAANACGGSKTVPATVVTIQTVDAERGLYQLWITSSRADGFAKPINWSPPADMVVTAITRTEHGRCSLVGTRIMCVATKPGRSVTVNFIAQVPPAEIDPADGKVVVVLLDIPRGLYQLRVRSATALGPSNAFTWKPPTNLHITAILSSEGAKCSIASGNLSCQAGGTVAPPTTCSCLLTVNFTATGLQPTSVLQWCGSMTPCPYHIPNFLTEQNDFPLCGSAVHPSKISTAKSPCTKK